MNVDPPDLIAFKNNVVGNKSLEPGLSLRLSW